MESYPSDQGVSPTHFLGLIPLTAESVLEISSTVDNLGEYFLRRSPSATWNRVKQLSADMAERFNAVVIRKSSYDAKDVFETLNIIKYLLKDNGVAIVEVSNPAHWQLLFLSLSSNEPFQAMPTADLGFPLSIEAIDRRFNHAGLSLRKAQAVKPALPLAISEMVDKICRQEGFVRPLNAELIKTKLSERSYLLCGSLSAQSEASIQHKASHRTRLTIAMLAMAPSFADVRTKLPLSAYATLPDVEVVYFERQGSLPSLPVDQPKVLVVQRQLPDAEDAWQAVVDRLHTKGWAVVAEWDDHPDLFAPAIRAKFDKVPWASVKLADAVQTSTELLASEIRRVVHRDVVVFDNRLLELPRIAPESKDGTVRVLMAGLNRTSEFLKVVEQLNQILVQGHRLEFIVVQDRRVFDAIHSSHKKFFPQLNYEEYNNVLSICNLVLMPLSDSLGNRCKSDLKWVECASHGIACIGSRVVYGETIRHGVDGLLADEIDDFGRHVISLLKSPGLITQLGTEARRRVANERLLCQVVEQRVSWYLSVWQSVFGLGMAADASD